MAKKMQELEAEYRARCAATGGEPFGEILYFGDIEEGESIYNISQRFTFNGEHLIAGRRESVHTEYDSWSVFYRETSDGHWERVPGVELGVQDPSVAIVKLRDESGADTYRDHLLVNGVQASPLASDKNGMPVSAYYLRTWVGSSLDNMVEMPNGASNQKGTRYVSLGHGEIGVFVRPQGAVGGLGKIGFTRIHAETVEELRHELDPDTLRTRTRMIEGLCNDDEWVGPNQIFVLDDGRLGVIGHIARWRNLPAYDRQYDAISFVYDPQSGDASELQIIATVNSFDNDRGAHDAGVDAKRDDLRWVLYPGGIERLAGGRAMLYCGIGDLRAGRVEIPDPFAGR